MTYTALHSNTAILPVKGIDGRERIKTIYGHEVQPGALIQDVNAPTLTLYRWAFIQGSLKRGYKLDPRFTVRNWDTGVKEPIQVKPIPLTPYAPGYFRSGTTLYWVHAGHIMAAHNYLLKEK